MICQLCTEDYHDTDRQGNCRCEHHGCECNAIVYDRKLLSRRSNPKEIRAILEVFKDYDIRQIIVTRKVVKISEKFVQEPLLDVDTP